jgi:hypothetical protein
MTLYAFITEILPWSLSAFGILMIYLAGNKDPVAWVVGLGNQCCWVVWIITTRNWGLLPQSSVLIVLMIRNLIKWRTP